MDLREILQIDPFALGGAKGEGVSGLGHWPEVECRVMESGVNHTLLASRAHTSCSHTGTL